MGFYRLYRSEPIAHIDITDNNGQRIIRSATSNFIVGIQEPIEVWGSARFCRHLSLGNSDLLPPWLPIPKSAYKSLGDVPKVELLALLRWRRNNAGSAVFSKKLIGAAQFNQVMVSLYRSFERLETRGLILKCGPGKSLTQGGWVIAASFSNNSPVVL